MKGMGKGGEGARGEQPVTHSFVEKRNFRTSKHYLRCCFFFPLLLKKCKRVPITHRRISSLFSAAGLNR